MNPWTFGIYMFQDTKTGETQLGLFDAPIHEVDDTDIILAVGEETHMEQLSDHYRLSPMPHPAALRN